MVGSSSTTSTSVSAPAGNGGWAVRVVVVGRRVVVDARVIVVWTAVDVTPAGAVEDTTIVVRDDWEVADPPGARAAQPATSRASNRSAAHTAAQNRGLVGARAALEADPRATRSRDRPWDHPSPASVDGADARRLGRPKTRGRLRSRCGHRPPSGLRSPRRPRHPALDRRTPPERWGSAAAGACGAGGRAVAPGSRASLRSMRHRRSRPRRARSPEAPRPASAPSAPDWAASRSAA